MAERVEFFGPRVGEGARLEGDPFFSVLSGFVIDVEDGPYRVLFGPALPLATRARAPAHL